MNTTDPSESEAGARTAITVVRADHHQTATVSSSETIYVRAAAAIVRMQGTGADQEVVITAASSDSRTYPHVADPDEPAGNAVQYVAQAHEDAQLALDALDEDIGEVATRLAQIAAALAAARAHASFNRAFSAACTFIRRASLAMEVDSATRAQLNVLIAVLSQLRDRPMLALAESVELIEQLSAEGWNGDSADVENLIAAWLPSINSENIKLNAVESAAQD